MKLILVALALIGLAAAQLDSATQGPNPQDIATPEPEYIDIDVPEGAAAPAPPPAPAPAPLPAPRSFLPSIPQPASQQYLAPQRSYFAPVQQEVPGHSYSSQSGYQYRRPVFIRRVYRHRRY